jgi:L-lactate utilization protein LutB
MKPEELYNALLARHVIEGLKKRNIEGFYFETKEEALGKILDAIPKDGLVSWGGSATLNEIGVTNALKSRGYNFLDPNDAQGGRAKAEIAHRALTADYYLMGANAITAAGELVNLDGIGNRVASLTFGPKHVIVVAGINKVQPDLDAAILRAKKRAAPLIMLKFKQDYPSLEELNRAAEAAIGHLVVTSMSTFPGRIKVILIGERLGY